MARSRPGTSVLLLHVYSVPLGWHKSRHSYEEFAAIMKGHAERHGNEYLAPRRYSEHSLADAL